MLNRTVLTGRLTRDPELRSTQSRIKVCSFTLAVDRQFRNKNGDRDADFINCVIWRKSAENFANFTHKGSLVGIDGRIQTRNYENNQGDRVYVTEVVVDQFALLDSRNSRNSNHQQGGLLQQKPQYSQKPAQPQANNTPAHISDASLPFNTNQSAPADDVSNDDLPFKM